jgi:hypothetical protein
MPMPRRGWVTKLSLRIRCGCRVHPEIEFRQQLFSYHCFHQGSANRQVNSAAIVEVAHDCNGTAKMVVSFQGVVAHTHTFSLKKNMNNNKILETVHEKDRCSAAIRTVIILKRYAESQIGNAVLFYVPGFGEDFSIIVAA